MCIYLKAGSPCKLCHEAKKKCTISGISVAESAKKRQGMKKTDGIASAPTASSSRPQPTPRHLSANLRVPTRPIVEIPVRPSGSQTNERSAQGKLDKGKKRVLSPDIVILQDSVGGSGQSSRSASSKRTRGSEQSVSDLEEELSEAVVAADVAMKRVTLLNKSLREKKSKSGERK
jgi:signal recognition particle GTPase